MLHREVARFTRNFGDNSLQMCCRNSQVLHAAYSPFPVITWTHKFEDYITALNKEKKTKITGGLATGY